MYAGFLVAPRPGLAVALGAGAGTKSSMRLLVSDRTAPFTYESSSSKSESAFFALALAADFVDLGSTKTSSSESDSTGFFAGLGFGFAEPANPSRVDCFALGAALAAGMSYTSVSWDSSHYNPLSSSESSSFTTDAGFALGLAAAAAFFFAGGFSPSEASDTLVLPSVSAQSEGLT